ncbi:hypothetical protein D3C80_1904220 [compost metagenome]
MALCDQGVYRCAYLLLVSLSDYAKSFCSVPGPFKRDAILRSLVHVGSAITVHVARWILWGVSLRVERDC